jgi:hypothetical protein
MRKSAEGKSYVGLAAIGMFTVFAFTILYVLLGGAKIYQRFTAAYSEAYDARTCMQYIATKVRQAPCADAVCVETFNGESALCIYEVHGEQTSVTRIYAYDGYLRELFSGAQGEFKPLDGVEILCLEDLDFAWKGGIDGDGLDGGLLTISLVDESGKTYEMTQFVRGSEVPR